MDNEYTERIDEIEREVVVYAIAMSGAVQDILTNMLGIMQEMASDIDALRRKLNEIT